MPTYEYECLAEGHRFEVKQSFSDPALDACQVCGEPVRKVFSAAGIVFKGSGYYVTDTRKGAKAPKGEKAAGAAKDSPKSDSGSSSASSSSTTSTSSSSDS